jgi:hypothetical protein
VVVRISVGAGKYVPDSIAAADSGELHHALEMGSVYGELTVADLTGPGIQNAAVAIPAGEHGTGRDVPLGDW